MKIAMVINGKGGIGKDTFCEMVERLGYKIRNISSITPVKEIAKLVGWQGTKEDKDRKFLSDLKKLFSDYNDLPTTYCYNEYKEFLQSDENIMFIHIREPKEIEKFVKLTNNECKTLLIRKKDLNHHYGNVSDDDVENYDYDYIYNNDKTLEEMPVDVAKFIASIE